MKLEGVIAALAPDAVLRGAPVEISDLAYDTRSVTRGALFFCYPGEHVDRHDLAAEALERGAVALVVERELELDVPQVVVRDARAAMAVVADEFNARPTEDLQVAGVTGTNGKTTTAFLIHSILDAAGRRPGLVTTIETRVGGGREPAVRTTPEAIDLQRLFRRMLDAGDRSCAIEATSHGSVLHRLDRVRFQVLVFTNLTEDHLDFHGTMEDYFAAKRRLFDQAEAAAVNVGDPCGRRLAQELGGPVVTFGLAGDAEVGQEALEGVELRLRGRFNLENALGAIAASRLLGVRDEAIATGIERVEGVPGRFEELDEGQGFAVIVDYSHTPDSLENALRTARDLAPGRVICVFGCGGDRDREKRPVMGRIAAELAEIAILTSDNPRSEDPLAILAEVAAGAPNGSLEIEPDRRAAIAKAVQLAREGDVVLIAGKGHEQGQQIGARKLHFDDRHVAREALRSLAARA
jgi:UDP-N-acetylmuramoyl-L-alanyl-D-glutamate--2,6-diaminopimelate ligase